MIKSYIEYKDESDMAPVLRELMNQTMIYYYLISIPTVIFYTMHLFYEIYLTQFPQHGMYVLIYIYCSV